MSVAWSIELLAGRNNKHLGHYFKHTYTVIIEQPTRVIGQIVITYYNKTKTIMIASHEIKAQSQSRELLIQLILKSTGKSQIRSSPGNSSTNTP